MEKENRILFNIESFLRTHSNYEVILKLDKVILISNLSDDEKVKLVCQLISEAVSAFQKSIK